MRLLLFIFLLSSLIGISQSENTVIVDELTNSPIPYIVITTENDVLSANENGEVPKDSLKDIPFKVVSDSYETQIFAAGFSADSIFMEQEAQLLEETNIVENKNDGESYQLGYYNESLKMFPVNSYSGGYSRTIVTYIPNDGKKTVVENLLFKLQKYEKDSLYTCILMSIDGNNRPNKEIFSYTLTGEMLKKKNPIDISNLEIEIPEEGLFVGIKSTTLTIRKTKKTFIDEIAFTKGFYGKDKHEKNKSWFPMYDLDFKNYVAPPFGLQMRLK